MKLAGPTPGLRFVCTPEWAQPVVRGIFPPENAPAIREIVVASARAASPNYRVEVARIQRQWEHEILYGYDDGREPVGILSAP